MSATILSIRQRVFNTVKTRLLGINGGSTYSRDIEGERLWTYARLPEQISGSGIILLRGEEKILKQYARRYECLVQVQIGFTDTGTWEDPSDEADQFMADIQLAMGSEFSIEAPHFQTGLDVDQTVQLEEVGNAINVSDATPGMIMGRLTYNITYRRNIDDPSKH